MKVRNKKTGEIAETFHDDIVINSNKVNVFHSLTELNAEWEDYEDSKEHYIINGNGFILSDKHFHSETIKEVKEFGNYFETKEEAEKAVEKLKAWKRLKDKGFKFTYWNGGARQINFEIRSLENEYYIPRQICDDLDLLFGGEE